jgi:hypothetical protein
MIDWSHPSGLPPDPNEMRFTAEDLAEIEPDDLDAELDAEEAKRDAEMRRLGFGEDEIARVRGRSVEEMTPQPKRSAADVERDLDEIRELRKSSRQRYWAKETQEREAALYAEKEALKDGGGLAKEEGNADESAGAGVEGIPQALKDEWEASPGGIETALSALRMRTTALSEILDAEEEESLRQSFDELPDEIQTEVVRSLAVDGGRWPKASTQDIADFGETAHGAELVNSWAEAAPVRLGAAKAEARYIESRLSERGRLQAHRWIAGRSSSEMKAVIEVLASRAARRSAIRAAERRR